MAPAPRPPSRSDGPQLKHILELGTARSGRFGRRSAVDAQPADELVRAGFAASRGTLVVQHGKGDKRRVVGVDAGTAALLGHWLDVHKLLVGRRDCPIFCTLRGNELNQSYVRHLLPRLARRAGIEKRVHAHALRHSFAVELEREGAPLSTIRDLLGHSSAAVTDRYLRRVGASHAIDFARRREW